MNEKNKGLIIMLEGTDGSGKTTQTELLLARLKSEGLAVETISFPQYGKPSAVLVESYLRGEYGTADEVGPYRASILYAVDRFAAKPTIEQWLAEGKIVIANRYVASNMGHQGGKIRDEAERQKYFDWEYNLEYTIMGIPKPDVNIILHMPVEFSLRLIAERTAAGTHDRAEAKDIHEENRMHLEHAEKSYLDLAKQYPEFTVVECAEGDLVLPREKIHESLWSLIAPKLH